MQTSELYFDLPPELIAQHPRLSHRDDRLLCIDRQSGEYQDRLFADLPSLLPEGAVLVLNDSKVRKARVYAQTDTGGRVELLFLRPLLDGRWECMISRRRRRKEGECLYIKRASDRLIKLYIDKLCADETIIVRTEELLGEDFFDSAGHVPLPPYIKRADDFADEKAYQTIYAKHLGSVASPTSGLHYTDEVLEDIKKRGIRILKLTLHVGMGTFLPLRAETLEEHRMHSEFYNIPEDVAEAITEHKRRGGAVVASGTTVVRTLESAWDAKEKRLVPGEGSTDIFITPGYEFCAVDGLITNFHTPQSTLLSLVAAFSSLDIVKNAYRHAVDEKYRFFSYGDCTYFF